MAFVAVCVFLAGMEFDRSEIAGFFDREVPVLLEKFDIPGAVLSFVSNGEVLYVNGYGVADLDSGREMEEDSLVRIGSVSKLFTWISIMQLYEQGRIDLKADVNNYISAFKIPDAFKKAITVENLLTHTTGFEEQASQIIQFLGYEPGPLVEELKDIPERVLEPGRFAAYSNYGSGVAGHIVEQVSGMEFSDYVDRNIIDRLQMKSTTFDQQLSDDLLARMSTGYYYENGQNIFLTPFEIIVLPPAGSASSSAGDMAKFMIANLQKGRFGDERILNEETAELMQSVHFQHDTRLNGMCYGFYEMSRNGIRLIGHGGDTILFHTLTVLAPEEDWGLFVSFNSIGSGPARDELLASLMDSYYPYEKAYDPYKESLIERIRVTGDYINNRRVYSDFWESLNYWRNPDIRVDITAGGSLSIGGSEWTAVEPNLVLSEKNKLAAFRREGAEVHLFVDSAPMLAFEKVPWYLSQRFVGSMFMALVMGLFMVLP